MSVIVQNNNSDINHSNFNHKRKFEDVFEDDTLSPNISDVESILKTPPTKTQVAKLTEGQSPMKKLVALKEWDWKSASIKAFGGSDKQSQFKDTPITIKKKSVGNSGSQSSSAMSAFESLKKLSSQKPELEQTVIDAGQKNVGQNICSKCKMPYSIGQKDDELAHKQYCQSIKLQKVVIKNWSNFKILNSFSNDHKIIVITKEEEEENSFNIKPKLQVLYNILNQEFGTNMSTVNNCSKTNRNQVVPNLTVNSVNDGQEQEQDRDEKIFLYLDSSDRILGCIIAERVTQGYQVLDNENSDDRDTIQCSKTPTKVLCGINKIWTLQSSRKKGIAKKLIDTLRTSMYYGYRLSNHELAITQPTQAGKLFFTKYFNTNHLILYNIGKC
ncbi:GCN5-related N-acetyltransferase [Tieghemostelium lacteum]|uniref:GCN5-related N-acetyltransferase n=1 Tax=Tieghemostelium lacteum TaxID=361077 RepID=A0A152A2V5_TIELA|nr:GCN5-related N-acetyltransferase [Tieghemostelium lacteum]|eukprot:KYR00539.1 GCN5-related N-acetyltransferase [Tieghemostelium lacteum]